MALRRGLPRRQRDAAPTSAHADRFILKGALLFTLWYDLPHRATRDSDLLGYGPSDTASMAAVFTDIASIAGDDGIVFDPASVRFEVIRKDAGYGGVRVSLNGQLANARCVAQVDVGFGDVVTPGPSDAVYPVLWTICRRRICAPIRSTP